MALSPFYAAGQTGALRVRPVVQTSGSGGVTITWLSLEDGPARLDFIRRGQAPRSVTTRPVRLEPGDTGLRFPLFQHRAELTGLEAGIDYAYSIHLNGRLATADGLSFRTAGRGPRFVALGDSGNGSPEQLRLAGMMASRRPDLMLHTGDLAYPDGTVEAYMERFFAPYAALLERMPVFPCPGNHDYYHEEAKFYVDLQAVPRAGVPEEGLGRYYSFDWDNAHIVVLDSNLPLVEAAEGRGPMLEWLERDLKATRQFWKIAMFHHPPFAGGPNQDDPLSHLAREWIVPILARHGVQLVLNGHEHNYQRSVPLDGVVYLTTGGGGAELYEPLPRAEQAVQQRCHHFLDARLDAASLSVQAVRLDGAVIDELRLRPVPQPVAVVNAASTLPELAPGALCALEGRQFAPREGALDTVTVRVNGERATVVGASAERVTFVMPASALGDLRIGVATANGEAEIAVTVQESAPGIFGLERDGQRLGALFHLNGDAVSAQRPVRAGDELSLYITGTGRAGRVHLESGDAAWDAVSQPVDGQPGVEVIRFRLPENAGRVLQVVAGKARSNQVPLWLAA